MNKFPAYFKVTHTMLGLLLFFYILYIGRDILVPLTFALIVAILLNPVVNFLQGKGVGRVLSITISMFILLILVSGVLYFIIHQVGMFRESLPELEKKFNLLSRHVTGRASEIFRVPEVEIEEWISTRKREGILQISGMLGNTLITISGIVVAVLLVPIYIFLYLFYKPLLLSFIGRVFSIDKHKTLSEILGNTKTVIQSYLVGLLIEMLIMTSLYSTVLFIVGVDYAIVLAVVGALFNLIPYIGGLIAVSLPVLMALITGTPMMALFVVLGYVIVQTIDNNLLVPVIVASKVRVNALVSIVVVLIWGALWGVAGMFLSIPLTAMFKVIFDRVKQLKPYGFLLGDTMPPIGRKIFRINVLQQPSPVVNPPPPATGPEEKFET